MPFLSVREETMDLLNLLRLEGESDADLIERIVEFSRCFMIARGASPSKLSIHALVEMKDLEVSTDE